MKSLMKTALLTVFTAVLGAAFAAAPAHAQTGSRVLVNIPFDFSVGNTALKADSYTVRETQAGVLAFNSDDGQEHQFVLTVRGQAANRGQEPHFVFTRYGNTAFLNRVFMSDEDDCHQLPHSSREKELIRTLPSGEELSLLVQLVR